jgi:hypothetical protein
LRFRVEAELRREGSPESVIPDRLHHIGGSIRAVLMTFFAIMVLSFLE